MNFERAAFLESVLFHSVGTIVEANRYGANGTPFSVILDKDGNVLKVIDGLYSAQELLDQVLQEQL